MIVSQLLIIQTNILTIKVRVTTIFFSPLYQMLSERYYSRRRFIWFIRIYLIDDSYSSTTTSEEWKQKLMMSDHTVEAVCTKEARCCRQKNKERLFVTFPDESVILSPEEPVTHLFVGRCGSTSVYRAMICAPWPIRKLLSTPKYSVWPKYPSESNSWSWGF